MRVFIRIWGTNQVSAIPWTEKTQIRTTSLVTVGGPLIKNKIITGEHLTMGKPGGSLDMSMLGIVEKVFPVAVLVLCVLACAVYAYNNKWGNAAYWASAALISVSVVFLIPRFG